jgi:hypothetical protein
LFDIDEESAGRGKNFDKTSLQDKKPHKLQINKEISSGNESSSEFDDKVQS